MNRWLWGMPPGGALGDSVSGVPDLFDTEPIVAWRAWRIASKRPYRKEDARPRPETPALYSMTYGVRWPTRKPMRAHCLEAYSRRANGAWSAHTAPCLDHICGVYAVLDRAKALAWLPHGPVAAFGKVALWGRVLRFEKGYRAEFAYPLELWVDEAAAGFADELSERYAVDVNVEAA